MGASVSNSGTKPDKSDSDYCQLHLSAVFNEVYVNTIYDQLPVYVSTGPSSVPDDHKSSTIEEAASTQLIKLKKVMAILGPIVYNDNGEQTAREVGTSSEKSAFAENNGKRMRLLLRIYQVINVLLLSVIFML